MTKTVDDVLNDRFGSETVDDDPVDTTPPADDAPVAEPVETPPAKPAAAAPPAETPAVDERGVPWKNRAIESRRKLERERKEKEQLQANLQNLQVEVRALRERMETPAAPVQSAPPVTQNAPALDPRVVQGKPLNEWPTEYLIALKGEDARYAAVADKIILERTKLEAATGAVEQIELKERHKTMDRSIRGMYPSVQNPDSDLRLAMKTVLREWRITPKDITERPEVMMTVVREAADRINLRPVRTNPNQTIVSSSGDDMAPATPAPPAPKTKSAVKLTADQERMAKLMGLSPERYMQEIEATANEPFLAGVDK